VPSRIDPLMQQRLSLPACRVVGSALNQFGEANRLGTVAIR